MIMATWLAETCMSFVLMYVPCIVINLLFRPTSAQYFNSNISFINYSDMFRYIYIFRESSCIAKVKNSIK